MRIGWLPLLVGIAGASQASMVQAQTKPLPPGRPLTTNDIAGGSFYTRFQDSRQAADGTRQVTKHVAFQPMSLPPMVSLSVTQIDVSSTTGHIIYSVSDGNVSCLHPAAADKGCDGFDITITAGPGTTIKEINVAYLAVNGLSPALVGGVSATITPK